VADSPTTTTAAAAAATTATTTTAARLPLPRATSARCGLSSSSTLRLLSALLVPLDTMKESEGLPASLQMVVVVEAVVEEEKAALMSTVRFHSRSCLHFRTRFVGVVFLRSVVVGYIIHKS